MDISDFGMRFKTLREEKHLTKTQVAKRLGISNSVISNYETGEKMPSLDTLIKIANMFNTTTDYLLGLNDTFTYNLNNLDEHQKSYVRHTIENLCEELKRANSKK